MLALSLVDLPCHAGDLDGRTAAAAAACQGIKPLLELALYNLHGNRLHSMLAHTLLHLMDIRSHILKGSQVTYTSVTD